MKSLRILFTLAVLLGLPLVFTIYRLTARERIIGSFPAPPVVELPLLTEPGGPHQLFGRVVGPAGEAVDQALVELVAGHRPYWTYTDADGSFLLEELPAGQVEIGVVTWGYPPASFPLAVPAPDDICELVMPPPPAPLESLPPILRSPAGGVVVSADESRPGDYQVVALPDANSDPISGVLRRRTQCDAAGHFRFDDLAHGSYELLVLPPNAIAGDEPVLARSPLIHDPEVRQLELVLECGAIAGYLSDPSGDPIAGAWVLATPEPDGEVLWSPVLSDELGFYEIPYLTSGRWRLRVRAGEAHEERVVGVEPRAVREVNFENLDPHADPGPR